jgi:hypothetical protein
MAFRLTTILLLKAEGFPQKGQIQNVSITKKEENEIKIFLL